MAVRGLTRFARPGQPAHCVHGLSNWLSPVVEPRSGLHPPCVQYTKKPVLSYELFFKYGGGGLTASLALAARSLRSRSVQLAVASCRPPVGASHPPGVCNTRKKSPYFRTSSSLNMAVRGGLTRFARPAGSPLTAFTVCPTGCRQLSTPGRAFIPRCAICRKPVLSYELFFKYGGEGGIDSLRSPCGQPAHCVHGLSNWLSPVVEPRSGLLIPPVCAIYEKKARTFVRALL